MTIPKADQLIEVTRFQDVGLIKDDTNPVFQRCSLQPQVRLPKLFEDQDATQGGEEAVPERYTLL